MPIYEYQCQACGEHHEFLEKVSDEPKTECPHCHQAQLSRQISAAGFQLKGTGWYVTDFRDNGKKPETKTEKESSKEPSKTTDTKPSSDTKKTD